MLNQLQRRLGTLITTGKVGSVPPAGASTAGHPTPQMPEGTPRLDKKAERYYTASQFQLMLWRFRKHHLAVIALMAIALLYIIALFSEFIAPFNYAVRHPDYAYAPPQRIHIFHEGQLTRPFVYGWTTARNEVTLAMEHVVDHEVRYPIHFLIEGEPYRMWGQFNSNLHLFGVEGDAPFFLFGTDKLGRDLLSRILYGTRISLSIGLLGVFFSLVIGIILGSISGYNGGNVDMVIQRIIEILRAFPDIPLWMGLSAALPPEWPVLRIYFCITLILALVGWTGIAREVRGKLLSLREQNFTMAARLAGVKESRIISHHLLPSFASHLIVIVTLSIPSMILAETALSFLGLGLRPPIASWGVLLQDAQNIRTIASYPWLMLPILFIVVTVLAFNFVGDGLRDAADPYS